MDASPHDHSARRRFAEEIERNFSVVASAGSGKTRSITDRIVAIARSPAATTILPRLVVVTFTNRAADEMQQRTRQEILRARLSADVETAFNRAYFGTIHSLCLKLLTEHGHHLGLPAPLELLTDDDDLWREFVQRQTSLGHSLNEDQRRCLFRHAQARDIMELGRTAGSPLLVKREIPECPTVAFEPLLNASEKRSPENIAKSKEELREWLERLKGDWEFLRWPIYHTSVNSQFSELWRATFRPLRRWVADCALRVAAEVQRDYREFRLERGVVTFDDQIALTDELLRHPVAGERIRGCAYRIILDEAQDTDPTQFSILLEMARPPGAVSPPNGSWLEARADPPRSGHFCMVGDFQQSIYRDRADLKHYRAVHNALLDTGAAERLELSVTFRLDQWQIDFVNATFREILNDQAGQVAFVELQPRPEVLPGQVIRLAFPADLLPKNEELREHQKAELEAQGLARWIRDNGLEKLRAQAWSDVAILCPRKAWFRSLATALRRERVPVVVQSETDCKADSPGHAWLTALCTIMVEPHLSYEVVGVLREIYGIPDHDLAVFCEGHGNRFELEPAPLSAGVVGTPLRELAELHEALRGQPLFAAVRLILERTRLRQRLTVLPPEDFSDLEEELDSLVAMAAEMETRGASLLDFAQKLQADLSDLRHVHGAATNAIQLITAQKAKGSEWQAVILPFLGRWVRSFSPRYPCLLKDPETGELLVALSKEDRNEEAKAAMDLAETQELERLLYVATTRARHTLVLSFDRDLFAGSQGKMPRMAMLKSLAGDHDGVNFGFFETLGTNAMPCARTAIHRVAVAEEEKSTDSTLPKFSVKDEGVARERAQQFPRKAVPSEAEPERELGDDELPLQRRRSIADTPATLYGRWWHSLFESFPWLESLSSMDAAYATALPLSPDRERSAAEWERARTGLLTDSSLTLFLRRSDVVVQTEVPFLWRRDEKHCLEGLIDLLLVDRHARECLLLDWKTNDVGKADEPRLRIEYRPQLAAYWQAIREITGWTVLPALYSTATGGLLGYSEEEMTAEWHRLARCSVV